MPPKKAAKNTKKAPITPPLPPHEDPKPIIAESSAKQELQLPPPVQEKPHSPAKEPIKEPANPKKTPEKTAETVEEKPNPSPENDNKAVVGVIKLNQFNNFQNVAAAGNKTTGGISEEEKKKLREMRFAGKSVAENTFDVSHVAEQEKQKMQDRAKRFNLLREDEEEMKKQKRAQRFNLASGNAEDDQKKIERAKRFGLMVPEVEDEKKKLRAAKFGIPLNEDTEFLKNKKIKQN